MSAQACMSGLFPPQGNQIWNEHINFQPVPIHTIPMSLDRLFFAWIHCERFQNAWNEYTNSTEYKAIFEQYRSLINYLEEKSGDKFKTLYDLHKFYDRLFVGRSKEKWYQVQYNFFSHSSSGIYFRFTCFSTPPWVENVMQENGDFQQISKRFFESQTTNTVMKRIRSGFLLKEILDQSKKIQSFQRIEPPKLRLYFAHDTTIVDMLNSLGLYSVSIATC